jgi:DNA invertase Pin-like site-specific DNA recombinase
VRAFLYARVSTADKEQDPRPQLGEMKAFSKQRGWTPFEWSESASTGKRRPVFEAMMQDARRGECDVIVCRHFDRIARSTRELLELLDELKSRNIEFVSVNQQIDTTTPAGRLMFTMIAAFAEFERSMTRERVKLGLAAARAKGKTLGRPRRIADALKIRTLRASGKPWGVTALECGVSVSTARRIAKNAPELPSPVQKPVEKKYKKAIHLQRRRRRASRKP